jgi:hypothetical protein
MLYCNLIILLIIILLLIQVNNYYKLNKEKNIYLLIIIFTILYYHNINEYFTSTPTPTKITGNITIGGKLSVRKMILNNINGINFNNINNITDTIKIDSNSNIIDMRNSSLKLNNCIYSDLTERKYLNLSGINEVKASEFFVKNKNKKYKNCKKIKIYHNTVPRETNKCKDFIKFKLPPKKAS